MSSVRHRVLKAFRNASVRVADLARWAAHIKYEKQTPLANLHMTLLDRVGVQLDSFADSNGRVEDLFDPVPV